MTVGIRAPFVAISGTIGSGKSTLTRGLAQALNVPAFAENPLANPHFGPPSDAALQTELWFLTEAISAGQRASKGPGGVLDTPSEVHLDVYARLKGRRNWISDDEHRLLESTYITSARPSRPPSLLVHLDIAPEVARERIVARHRAAELDAVDLEYLRELNHLYESFLRRWTLSPVLRVYSDRLDFANRDTDLQQVIQEVEVHLNQELAIVRRPGVPMPVRKLPGDAGIDLACAQDVTLEPLCRAVVPTGVRMHIPEGHVGLIVPRSGLARDGITHLDSPGIIDSGYRGEVHFLLYNTNTETTFTARAGERLGQIVIVPFRELQPTDVVDLSPSIRDKAKFNSTGR